MFSTRIRILGNIKDVEKVCIDTKAKDPTFQYDITPSYLTVYSSTEKEANHRGGWLIHKVKNCKLNKSFRVKEIK